MDSRAEWLARLLLLLSLLGTSWNRFNRGDDAADPGSQDSERRSGVNWCPGGTSSGSRFSGGEDDDDEDDRTAVIEFKEASLLRF